MDASWVGGILMAIVEALAAAIAILGGP